MRIKTALRLTILGLSAYGGYTLWNRYGSRWRGGVPDDGLGSGPSVRRVQERSVLTVDEIAVGSDDPVAQATAILAESDERSRLPRTADGIERRRSEDTVEPQ